MATAAVEIDTSHVSRGYRNYVMSLLLTIYILNFLDRQIVNILAEPIKNDLQLADWQLGLMGGLAFALLYTVLGLPISLLAERKDRSIIISIAIAVWSACTAASGMAQNFVQLVLARVGVGIGEAGCTPPAHSLIIDYADKKKRGSALAFYGMGPPIGGLLGMALGGLIADAYGWRVAFFLAGVPGILLALIAYFTLKDPRFAGKTKQEIAAKAADTANRVTIRQTLAALATRPSFRWVLRCSSLRSSCAIIPSRWLNMPRSWVSNRWASWASPLV